MKSYTPYQYMLIDIANHYGLDKLTFEDRIQWTLDRESDLESLTPSAESSVLFAKGVHHLRKIQKGEPTGYMVSLDCTASGPQILAAVTGCKQTARIVNLIDPDVRYDAYTESVNHMNERLPEHLQIKLGGAITRNDIKDAIIPFFFGSTKKPKEILGEGTQHYIQFFDTMKELFKGAYTARETLLDAWQPFALSHSYTLPDNHTAYLPNRSPVDKRIEVQELGGATFTHRVYLPEGTETGVSLVANVTHSIDGYLVRELVRRCNYDVDSLKRARTPLFDIMEQHNFMEVDTTGVLVSLADIYRIPTLTYIQAYSLLQVIDQVLEYPPFELAAIHDSFWCSPLHMDRLRLTFIELMAELAESTILEDILNEIHGTDSGVYTKESSDLGELIRSCNYPLS